MSSGSCQEMGRLSLIAIPVTDEMSTKAKPQRKIYIGQTPSNSNAAVPILSNTVVSNKKARLSVKSWHRTDITGREPTSDTPPC